MTKKKGVRILIIVEDEALECFSRRVLLEFGFHHRELHVTKSPAGQGSAKDWVDKQYPVEVRAMRSKAYQDVGLVIGTDADEATVDHRKKSLATALQDEGVKSRKADERIVFWIPKWNVETWILYFADDARDEDTNYKHKMKRPDNRATAKAFVAQYREYIQGSTINTQPSLQLAYNETKRLGV